MTTITQQVKINAAPEKVWKILADVGGISKFNPGVTKSYSTSKANAGLGASRHCDLLPMGSVEERVIEWNEGENYKIEIYEGKGTPPFKMAVASLGVKPDGKGSRVTMSLEYVIKFGLIGRMMDALMIKRQFAKAVPGILAGLKQHAEIGQLIDRKVQLNFVPIMSVA